MQWKGQRIVTSPRCRTAQDEDTYSNQQRHWRRTYVTPMQNTLGQTRDVFRWQLQGRKSTDSWRTPSAVFRDSKALFQRDQVHEKALALRSLAAQRTLSSVVGRGHDPDINPIDVLWVMGDERRIQRPHWK